MDELPQERQELCSSEIISCIHVMYLYCYIDLASKITRKLAALEPTDLPDTAEDSFPNQKTSGRATCNTIETRGTFSVERSVTGKYTNY